MKNLIDSFSYPVGIFMRGTRIVFVFTVIIIMLTTKSLDSFNENWAILFITLHFLEKILIHYQQRLFGEFFGRVFIKQYPHWSIKLFVWGTGVLLMITYFYSLYLFNKTESAVWIVANIILWWVFLEWVAEKIGSWVASIKYTDKSTYPHYQHFYIG
jgi:hypothetical protein